MIYCFTDFGYDGPYMGQMRAKIAEIAPQEGVIDLMVDVPTYNVSAASYLLAALIRDMPQGGIYLCVVDPGVGSERKPIIIECDGRFFVGPDNGIFHQVIKQAGQIKAYEIIWRPERLSNSFHGRDLFAPVCAFLASNQMFERKEINLDGLLITDQDVACEVIYIDHYGNCWTKIFESEINKTDVIRFSQNSFSYARVFSETDKAEGFWYINSSGLVEIAANCSNAALDFEIEIGSNLLIEKTSL